MLKTDLKIFIAINNLPGKFIRTFFYTIHYLAYIIPPILAVYLLLLSHSLKLTVFSICLVIVSWMFTVLLKLIVKRPRPKDSQPNVKHQIKASLKSFPSGHATIMFAICAVLYILEMPNLLQPFSIFAFLVSLSRIYLGAHYPSDVIVGILIGLATPFLILDLFQYNLTFK